VLFCEKTSLECLFRNDPWDIILHCRLNFLIDFSDIPYVMASGTVAVAMGLNP
jgi:hypothetical protein